MSPEFLGLSRVEFVTIGTVGPPGQRTFYLQAQQGDMLVTLIIEKEHAAALAMGIHELLGQLGGVIEEDLSGVEMSLREPLEPLFRVGSVGLGYDEEEDAIIVITRALVDEDAPAPEVHLWCSHAQSYALAEHALEMVMSGRPRCPLCDEPMARGEDHNCIRHNGRKWIFRVET